MEERAEDGKETNNWRNEKRDERNPGRGGEGGGGCIIMEDDESDVMVISDESNTGVIEQSVPFTHLPPVIPKPNVEEEKKMSRNEPNVHQTTERTDNLEIEEMDRFVRYSEKCVDNKNKSEEGVMAEESVRDESQGAFVNQGEESVIPSSIYCFDMPVMAMKYVTEFKNRNNFTKSCKWSPDGSCLLVAANDSRLRLYNLPRPLLWGSFKCESWFTEEADKYSLPAVTVKEPETVYDNCWYPLMQSDVPSSCCFASTSGNSPIHLWDAWSGNLICSYEGFNHLDQMVAAYSVKFSLDGSKVVAGYNKCLRVFRTHRPGRDFDQIEAKESGIVSCMSFNPQLPTVFAAGSYLGSIGLYNLERNRLFCRMEGDIGGVTQVKFSSCGTKLFSGSRKNNEILCWDIRNPGTLLCAYGREINTNQRIYFDLEPHYNRFLVSGDTSGRVLKWDVEKDFEVADKANFTKEPSSVFTAHMDCTNGLSLNPYCSLLATSSGQRHFPEPVSDSNSDSENEEPRPMFKFKAVIENTVKLWWLGST